MNEYALLRRVDDERQERQQERARRKQEALERWESVQFYDVFVNKAWGWTLVVHHSDAWKTQEIRDAERNLHYIVLGKKRACKLAYWLEKNVDEAIRANQSGTPFDPRNNILARAGLYEVQS